MRPTILAPSPGARAPSRAASRALPLLAAVLFLPAASRAQESHGAHAGVAARAADTTSVRLLPGLGRLHRRVSTTSPRAQQFFDQGLSLAYAFNHGEALRAFREAARLDPRCAMCQWGIAYVAGPNINAPMDAAMYPVAHAAIERARALAARATPRERALIDALATRYAPAAPAAPAGRAALDSAYAVAMARLAERWPADPDVRTLHAESLMLLSPWVYWTADRQPRPGTSALLASLERAMRADADHPGACHLYIHAVEAAFPQRAVACAERLAALMPGAGHIVHMPGHIYLRVGRYHDAIEANRHAVHADEQFMADAPQRGGFYAIAYYPHNHHFLSFAATMAGREALAVQAARDAARHTPADVAAAVPELQLLVAFPALTMVAFSDWDAVLREPAPPASLGIASALATYARGLAWAGSGDLDSAAAALVRLRAASDAEARYPVGPVLQIARRALEAEVAAGRGDSARAVTLLEEAVALEDGLTYMEPPYWHQPVRHRLGALLLAHGRAADAVRRYREDLERFPENVWSLAGLEAALTATGARGEASAVRVRLDRIRRQAGDE